MEKVRFGIIGAGNILSSHKAALQANPEYELIGVCRRSKDKLKAICEELGVKGVTDYHDLLAEKPDVVLVSLPHGMHCDVTIEAFQAGCHVLVEKPMAVSVEQCNRMLAAAKEYDKQMIVTEAASFYPGVVLTGEKFTAGLLGRFFTGSIITERPYFHKTRPAWFLDPAMSGGGMFSNVGVHRLAVARACLPGLAAVSVSGSVCHQDQWQVEACTSALVKYRDGGSMLYEEVGYYPKPAWLNQGTHMVFEEGIVSWTEDTWRIMKRSGEEVTEPPGKTPGYAPIYANMLKAIRGEDYSPKAWELAADTAIAQAAYASSRLGRDIDLTNDQWAIVHRDR